MNVIDMMRSGELHPLIVIIPIQMIIIAAICFFLAKIKNRNYKLSILVGLIPGINCLALIYYVVVSKKEKALT